MPAVLLALGASFVATGAGGGGLTASGISRTPSGKPTPGFGADDGGRKAIVDLVNKTQAALERLGPTPAHRRSFGPVKLALAAQGAALMVGARA